MESLTSLQPNGFSVVPHSNYYKTKTIDIPKYGKENASYNNKVINISDLVSQNSKTIFSDSTVINSGKEIEWDNRNMSSTLADTELTNPESTSSKKNLRISPMRIAEFPENGIYVLLSLLASEDSESGVVNESELYFKKLFEISRLESLNILMTLFFDSLDSETQSINVLVSTLHLISHFEYEQIYPSGQLMALAALSHKNDLVCEFAIKCYENWEHYDGISKLRTIHFNKEWLNEYAEEVIRDLEGR